MPIPIFQTSAIYIYGRLRRQHEAEEKNQIYYLHDSGIAFADGRDHFYNIDQLQRSFDTGKYGY